MVEDIAAPPHIVTRALDEFAVQVSIALVEAAEVGCSRDLNNAPAAISDIAGCSGIS